METSWRSCHRACRAGARLALAAAALAFPALTRAVDPVIALAADPVVAAAGDIACDPAHSKFNGGDGTSSRCRQRYTSELMLDVPGIPNVDAVLPLGDTQYYCGGQGSYELSYALSWGRPTLKAISYPVPGNHEYLTNGGSSPSETTGCTAENAGAAGYFRYFGTSFGTGGDPSRGYYSYDLGPWHIIALNSNCSSVGGCDATSPQGVWLRQDLAAHHNACTLAYWHAPLFSSGGRGSTKYRSFWEALYEHDADVVLTAHEHIYERFAPQTPTGQPDPARGIRQWIVGTGGSGHGGLSTTAANSEVRNNKVYGVLRMTLQPAGYTWKFEPEARDRALFSDEGTGVCHGSEPDITPPTAPGDLTATAPRGDQVDLTWTASTDDTAVMAYEVHRDGTLIATTAETRYTDATVAPTTTYTYAVRAVDGAGNASPPSNEATVTTPEPPAERVLSFAPSADAWIEAASPDINHGSAVELDIDKSPLNDGLLKFEVSGLGSGTVAAVELQVTVVNGSGGSTTLQVYPAANAWSESTVTWATAPAADTTRRLAFLGPTSSGQTHTLDLGTSYVTGDGTYTLRLVSGSSDGTEIGSREAPSIQRPVLTVTAVSEPSGPSPEQEVAFPARAAFYYAWFPETWTVDGSHVFYQPKLGYYRSDDQTVVDAHVRSLDRADVQMAIASWAGPGRREEQTRLPLLFDRTAASMSGLKWTVYYEAEADGNPTVEELQADLDYLERYTTHSSWAHVGGKPVIFVYALSDGCEAAERWSRAAEGWYVSLKLFSGHLDCAVQPDAWHQYGPASPAHEHRDSYVVSPGFWRADETAPRLERDLARWRQNVRDMVASGKPWQLVTTFNEWGEGTAVEGAAEWDTESGEGLYLDALATDGAEP